MAMDVRNLTATAERRALQERGHFLGEWRYTRTKAATTCRLCGSYAEVDTELPLPNRLWGPAFSGSCPVMLQWLGFRVGPLVEEAVLRQGLVMGYISGADDGPLVVVGYDWRRDTVKVVWEDGEKMEGRYWQPVVAHLGELATRPRWKAVGCTVWAGAAEFHRQKREVRPQ